MKMLRPFLLPLCAVPLIWILLRDPRSNTQPAGTVPAGAIPTAETSTIPPAENPGGAPGPVSAPMPAGIVHALPRTTAELNTLADGPLPLPDKMAVLTELMKSGTVEQAKAAAIRAIFIVKNADYAAHLQPLIVQGKIQPGAMEVLSLNLYDRPLGILLPAWAQILEHPDHPLAVAAADGLEFHLKEKASARGPALAQAIKDCLSPVRN